MEATQSNTLIAIIFTGLICLIAALGFYTWNLANEVQALRESNTQTTTSTLNSSLLSNSNTPPAAPVPATPNAQSNPAPGFNDPFAGNWPGFMDPGGQIAEMQQRMDELMNSMTRGTPFFNQQDFGFGFSSSPTISMSEDNEAFRIIVEVPEGQEVELNTELNNNVLVVSGSVKTMREEGAAGFNSRSMQESRFSQSMHLSGEIDEDAMTVEQQDNEIIITVPKV